MLLVLEEIPQFISNTLVMASELLPLALGFSLIFSTTRFFHFAHGIVFTVAAYFVLLFFIFLHIPFVVSIGIAIALSATLGCAIDRGIYQPLRKKKSSPLVMLLASLGGYIVLQNLISLIFGDDTKTIRTGGVKEGLNIFGAYITLTQITIIVVAVILQIALLLLLKRTKLGRAIRAVSTNPEMARISGIDSERIILYVFGLGSALAGLAGILVALDVDMTPTMGMHALMLAVVAVVIGGVGNITGTALGTLLLGFLQNFAAWKISSQWQDAIAFGILLIILIFKPEGFLGKKIEKTTI